jgi:hypothetical protein
MAATALTVQIAPHGTGLNPVTMSATMGGFTGHTCPCGPNVFLLLNNTASACSLTMHVPAGITVDGLSISSRIISVAAGIFVVPVPSYPFADPVTGLCTFDLAAGTISGACVYSSA